MCYICIPISFAYAFVAFPTFVTLLAIVGPQLIVATLLWLLLTHTHTYSYS